MNETPEPKKRRRFLTEFKKFAIRGNAIDLAVGVIIGGAFGKIVTSLVNDILTPLLGAVTGNIDFSNRFFVLSGTTYASLADARAANAPVMTYGTFLQNVVDFILVALVIFIVVKVLNKVWRSEKQIPKQALPTRDQQLLTEIRDLLKNRAEK